MIDVEIESLAEFDRRIAAGAHAMRGWHLQSVDLSGRTAALAAVDVTRAMFLGCRFAPGVEDAVRDRGGLVFPEVPDLPFDPYRPRLYTPDELYADLSTGYPGTPDALVYAWSREPRSLDRTLAQALHDHAIDDALQEYVAGRHLVGVMGGHSLQRGSSGYRSAAMLGRALSAGHTVATGGGPGAMEAANLGAYLRDEPEEAVDEAIRLLSRTPDFRPDIGAWAAAAVEVRRSRPGMDSLGVPTWFYGHEPPNAFATHIAKYFTNAIREQVLLHICRAGIVFLPGAAGTVQEIFQTACENYYADRTAVAPMVLVGRDFWTGEVPAWPLLHALAAGRPMAGAVHLVDHVEEVLPVLNDLRTSRPGEQPGRGS